MTPTPEPTGEHVHDWRFDGDDPYAVCRECGEYRDAITGKTILTVGSVVAPTSTTVTFTPDELVSHDAQVAEKALLGYAAYLEAAAHDFGDVMTDEDEADNTRWIAAIRAYAEGVTHA